MNARELTSFLDEVARLRGGNCMVVSDSAYRNSCRLLIVRRVALSRKYPNLVVLRTFSKAYGLAGLGSVTAWPHRSLSVILEKIRMPFNLSIPGLAAAEAAFGIVLFSKGRSPSIERG